MPRLYDADGHPLIDAEGHPLYDIIEALLAAASYYMRQLRRLKMDLLIDTEITLTVGPFVDVNLAPLESLGASDISVTLFKAGGSGVSLILSGSNWTNKGLGYYALKLTPDTLGALKIDLVGASALPYWEDYRVVTIDVPAATKKIQAAVYDSAPASGSVITLSNGATQTIDATGRVTA